MSIIVGKLTVATGETSVLVVTDDVRVGSDLPTVVARIGAWKGDIFAVWETETGLGPNQVGEHVQSVRPDALHVLTGTGDLFQLDDRHLDAVAQECRG
ncbi:hypothetical protein ACFZAM_31755 [Streptomyces sp. NPDC008079]|uniref:hypothetical protein n=1 Tax=Streptomyces sp. NPDC008079 TaxID=3364806 RepID=UPI0036EA3796